MSRSQFWIVLFIGICVLLGTSIITDSLTDDATFVRLGLFSLDVAALVAIVAGFLMRSC
jgi:hypothetical protein